MTSLDPSGLPKITQLRIAGLRVIKDVVLDLKGITVLIGDNGTGKSSILEALELLRQLTTQASFTADVIDGKHGGLRSLLRRGADALQLGCRIQTGDSAVDYDVELKRQGDRAVISRATERRYENNDFSNAIIEAPQLDADEEAKLRAARLRHSYFERVLHPGNRGGSLDPDDQQESRLRASLLQSILMTESADSVRPSTPARLGISAIDVHVPFETRPLWQQQELDLHSGPRVPRHVEPTSRLSRFATNLVNAFLELRNRGGDTWEKVIEQCRLGIREDLRNFSTAPARRGELELQLVFGRDPDHPMPVEYLSEGQLAYLAMVALCALSERSSILAFDEPEVHLHPGLLARVVAMLEELSETTPVLLSTHSDRLLDCLSNPAASVILCDLDEHGATRLRRPNQAELDRWLVDYRGLGSLRAEGYVDQVFDEESRGAGDPRS